MKSLEMVISYACNNACVFCLNKHNRHLFIKGHPIEFLKNKIDFAAKEGFEKLTITGGEPLLSSNFFNVINYAKQKGIKRLEIQSNGQLLSDEVLVRKLVKYEPIGFLISLHFPNAKLYKKYELSDVFDKTINGIKNLIKNNLNVTINTVIMKPNLPHLEEIVELLRKLKIKRMQYRFINGVDVVDEYEKFVPRYSKVVKLIRKIIKSTSDIQITVNEIPICILGEQFQNHLAPVYGPERLITSLSENFIDKTIDNQSSRKKFFVYPNCEGCIYRSNCLGIRRLYFENYGGGELKPILTQYGYA